jgi:hypothetical protein
LKLRAQLLRAWLGPLPAAAILPVHYPLEVASERTECDACCVPLRRQRTSTRLPAGRDARLAAGMCRWLRTRRWGFWL